MAKIPGAVDVNVHQLIDAPQFDVNMDRQQAIQMGFTASDVANSLLISLSSSGQTARNYWVNPANGVNYLVAVQTPQYQVDSLNALTNTPIIGSGSDAAATAAPTCRTFKRDFAPVVINHYNIQPTFDIYADAQDRDLGGVSGDIDEDRRAVRAEAAVVQGDRSVQGSGHEAARFARCVQAAALEAAEGDDHRSARAGAEHEHGVRASWASASCSPWRWCIS